MVQDESEEEGNGDANGDDDDDDNGDNMPIGTLLGAKRAQSSVPAADDVAVVDIFDSPKETRGAELVQSHVEPIPYLQPELESSAVIRGMFTPDEPSLVDLGGDPNMVSSESSSSSEESENFINYSTDRDLSPSHAATSKICEPPPPADSRGSVGQDNIVGEPVTAAAVQQLWGEEEDDIQELHHPAAGGPSMGQHGTGSTSTPSGSQQHSFAGARIRSTESFLGRVAVGSPGCSNASILRGPRSTRGGDVATDTTSPHSPVCSTSQTLSPRPLRDACLFHRPSLQFFLRTDSWR